MSLNNAQLEDALARGPRVLTMLVVMVLIAGMVGGFDHRVLGLAAAAGVAQYAFICRGWKVGSGALFGLFQGLQGGLTRRYGGETFAVLVSIYLQGIATYGAFALAPFVIWRERAKKWLLGRAS